MKAGCSIFTSKVRLKTKRLNAMNPVDQSLQHFGTEYEILVAEAGGNPDFPEIFTYWKCPDGTQIDLVASGADLPKQEDGSHGDGIHTYKRLYSFLLTWVLFIYSTI